MLIQVLDILFNLIALIFLLRLILSEIGTNPFNSAIRFLYRVTDPVLEPIRKVLPVNLKDKLYIDVSPLIALLLTIAVKFFLLKILSVLLKR